MIEWSYIVIVLSALLLLFLLWKEIKRKNKSRLLWRIVATILGVVSLACMALPVTYRATVQQSIGNEAVLLTDGFNADSVRRVINANANIPVLYFDRQIKAAEQYNAHYVADLSLLPQQYKDIHLFHVFGYGLDKEELNSLQKQTLIFHASKLPSGITAIHWAAAAPFRR